MISRYTYEEPIIKTVTSDNQWLSVEENNSSLLKIFRLLSGTVRVYDEFEEKKFLFKTNYFLSPYEEASRYKQSLILQSFPEEIGINDLSTFFNQCRQNNNFYKKIEAEVLNCLVARKKGRYLESFLFVYRILEGISYSIPLIYTSKTQNFERSFTALQSYMSKNKSDGELQFFKKFISEVYKGETFFDTTIDIKLSSVEVEELRPIYFSIYKNQITKDEYLYDEVEGEELKLTFIGFFHFLIELRNRYFHFLQGTWKNNINTSSVLHPDLFFKPIVDLAINWVAIIFFETIKFDFENSSI